MQADLIFKKLTGLEKPKGHSLTSIALATQSEVKRPQAQRLGINQFVKALSLVGIEAFRMDQKTEMDLALSCMITQVLAVLDQQIQQSVRGQNTNA